MLLFLYTSISFPQVSEEQYMAEIANCKTIDCRVINSFKISEFYLETDEISKAQKWIDSCKIWNAEKATILPSTDVSSLQSELFYYFGLFQFGITEADKGIEIANKENDSIALADLYFFKGINNFEIQKYEAAQKALKNAEKLYPKVTSRHHHRTFILPEHIYNNLGQLKLQLKQWDSAYYYNSKAYKIAQFQNSGRAIANCEQTFGLIHLGKKNNDSALFYLKKSKETALLFTYYDVATLAEGFMMHASFHKKDSVIKHFKEGEQLLLKYPINTLFKKLFYKEAVTVFDSLQMPLETILLQHKILQIEDSIRLQGNSLIQDISQQYIETEKELFNLQRNEFERQEKLNLFQFIALLLVIFLLIVMVLLFRRKNKEQHKLLQQKIEISNDLHDDIGSGLTSILIHSQLLENNPSLSTEQKQSASKIYRTGAEISQRLNTFIWTLNEANDTLQGFLEYVKHYASKTFEGTGVDFHYYQDLVDGLDNPLSGQLRKNLFYCVKELITNTLKHANATQAVLKVNFSEKKQLQLTFEDNGVGFSKENNLGNGLLNIEKRMKLHKGQFLYTSENGFKAILKVSL
ncbi:MAG: hypothetical protein R2786_03815 [Flavobacteriaceae bacterium]